MRALQNNEYSIDSKTRAGLIPTEESAIFNKIPYKDILPIWEFEVKFYHININSILDPEPLEFPDSSSDKFENCPTCDRVGLNTESKVHKQCIFCDYLLINENKKIQKGT